MNNHPSEPEPGGDIQGYEGDVPGENTNRDMNRTTPQLSAGEACQTLTATGYGFTRDVHHLRPVSELAQMLVRSAAAGANFLLNADPTPEGVVAAPAVDRLTRIGSWLRGSSEGIYGTRAGVLHVADQFGDDRHCGAWPRRRGASPGGTTSTFSTAPYRPRSSPTWRRVRTPTPLLRRSCMTAARFPRRSAPTSTCCSRPW